MSASSRRNTNTTIRLVGRHPDDYAEELQRFLEKLARQVHGGIPAGFNSEAPTRVEADATADPGTEASGWAAADHQHDLAVAVPSDLANATSEGTSAAVARADHLHKRDIRVQSDGADVGTRNALNLLNLTFFVTDNPGNDSVDIERPVGDLYYRVVTADDSPVYGQDNVLLVDATGGPVNITLPPSATFDFFTVVVKKIDASANAVTVTPDGAETIDGLAPVSLPLQWDLVHIIAANGQWYKIAM